MRTATLVFLTAATWAGATWAGLSAPRAADLDYGVLRGPDYEDAGPVGVIDWSGVYVGGHGGYTSGSFGFRNAFQPLVAQELRRSVIEQEFSVSTLLAPTSQRKDGASFGGLIGYNVQFDDLVLGIEADYTSLNLLAATSDAISRQSVTSNGFQNVYNLNGTSSTKIQDYGTIRARAGYALGSFLPFVTAGVAIGRARIADNVGVQTYGYDQTTYRANQSITVASQRAFVNNVGYSSFNQSVPDASVPAPAVVLGQSKTKVVGGAALGAGLEFALTSNIILRGEYQYVLFDDFGGHKSNLNTLRGGAAVKF